MATMIRNDCYASGKRCRQSGHTLETRTPPGLWCRYDKSIISRLRQAAGYGEVNRFVHAARVACARRAFFATSQGLNSVGLQTIQPSDTVVVMFGASVAYVLRREGTHYRLIGDCYVHSLMDGEAVRMWKDDVLAIEDFGLR
jgi:hypothetical protein